LNPTVDNSALQVSFAVASVAYLFFVSLLFVVHKILQNERVMDDGRVCLPSVQFRN